MSAWLTDMVPMLFSGESYIIITMGRFKQSFDGSGGEDLIPKQIFGRSGHLSSRILLGAAAFSDVTQDEADQAMESGIFVRGQSR